jgi:hypothetical protein
LDERIFGIHVVDGIGLNHPDESVGKRDIASMALFSGVHSRVHGFVALPVSHTLIKLPMNDFVSRKKNVNTRAFINHKANNKDFALHAKSLSIKTLPPPLPKMPYQISRLKWIFTDDPTATKAHKYTNGYFQGAFIVPETNVFSIVALKDDWVLKEFDPQWLRETKEHAVEGLTARRSKKRFVTIPPGVADSKAIPPSSLIHYMRRCKFQQGRSTRCLMDAFCSAMFDFGAMNQVMQIRKAPDFHCINQSNSTFWVNFVNLVNTNLNPIGLRCFRQKHYLSIQGLLELDDAFVIIATLRSNDGMQGQHAVAIFNGGIYDANSRYVMKKTQESLNWCCGEGGEICMGSVRSYQILPQGHRHIPVNMRFLFQTRDDNGCNTRGWVTKIGDDIQVQVVNGTKCSVSKKELSDFTRLN